MNSRSLLLFSRSFSSVLCGKSMHARDSQLMLALREGAPKG
jgi:hypothetical protein